MKRTITVMSCDNPKCENEDEHTRAEPALGYHVSRGEYHITFGGGPIPPTYACSIECLGEAVKESIYRAENPERYADQ